GARPRATWYGAAAANVAGTWIRAARSRGRCAPVTWPESVRARDLRPAAPGPAPGASGPLGPGTRPRGGGGARGAGGRPGPAGCLRGGALRLPGRPGIRRGLRARCRGILAARGSVAGLGLPAARPVIPGTRVIAGILTRPGQRPVQFLLV